MYDSGGISLKPTRRHARADEDGHVRRRGVLASMSALPALECRRQVTGYLMCTDNMPSGQAMKLGDVLTIRNGKTVEIHNTDAEGRLVLADGLSLAVEEQPDAIVDIATLTGACMVRPRARRWPACSATTRPGSSRCAAAADATDEPVWQLPLAGRVPQAARLRRRRHEERRRPVRRGDHRRGCSCREFVGDVPWAHLDIAGPMNGRRRRRLASPRAPPGFGTRLLIDLATELHAAPLRSTPARRSSRRRGEPASQRAAAAGGGDADRDELRFEQPRSSPAASIAAASAWAASAASSR